MKILYLDCETTGLNPVLNNIIQVAGMIEIDGEVKEEFDFKCQPFSYANISAEAIKINGISIEEMKTYPEPKGVQKKVEIIFDKYIDKYNKLDKFIPAGHKIGFDVDFLTAFFKKAGNSYCRSYIDYHELDNVPLLMTLQIIGKAHFDSFKLENVSKQWGIEIASHNALSDMRAARKVLQKILEMLK